MIKLTAFYQLHALRFQGDAFLAQVVNVFNLTTLLSMIYAFMLSLCVYDILN